MNTKDPLGELCRSLHENNYKYTRLGYPRCSTCAWRRVENSNFMYDSCTHPALSRPENESPTNPHGFATPWIERDWGTICSKEGKLWQGLPGYERKKPTITWKMRLYKFCVGVYPGESWM